MNNDHFVSFIFLRNEIDFAHQLDFVFVIWLVWDLALNCFSLWFSLRSLLFSFSYFSSIDSRLDHCEITISHYLFSIHLILIARYEVLAKSHTSHTNSSMQSPRKNPIHLILIARYEVLAKSHTPHTNCSIRSPRKNPIHLILIARYGALAKISYTSY
jgi:hypothetical protein